MAAEGRLQADDEPASSSDDEQAKDVSLKRLADVCQSADLGDELNDSKPVAKAKAKGRGKTKAKAQANGVCCNDDEPKRCTQCRVLKVVADFQRRQNVCKECRNAGRQLFGMAERQGKKEWLAELKTQKPKEFEKLLNKVSTCAPNAQGRKDFNLVMYAEEVYADNGVRSLMQRKMMWEGEYYEWARSAEAGP